MILQCGAKILRIICALSSSVRALVLYARGLDRVKPGSTPGGRTKGAAWQFVVYVKKAPVVMYRCFPTGILKIAFNGKQLLSAHIGAKVF